MPLSGLGGPWQAEAFPSSQQYVCYKGTGREQQPRPGPMKPKVEPQLGEAPSHPYAGGSALGEGAAIATSLEAVDRP